MLNKKVHWSLPAFVVSAMMLGFVDAPFFAAAEEIKMNTPLIRQYKVAQEVVAPAPSDAGATQSTPMAEPVKPIEQAPQPTEEQKVQPPMEEERQMEMEFVDPREIKRVLQEIKNMKFELNRFIKQLKKTPNSADDIAICQDVINKLNEHYKTISKPPEDMSVREAMQEFYEGQYWETVNVMRAKVELPKQLAEVTKQLKRVQKMLKQKAYQNLGFDMNALNQRLSEIQAIYDEAQAQYKAGELEDAMETMRDIFEGMHPGELNGILNQFREIKLRVKSIRNVEVKAIVEELLGEVIAAVNDGDFREANMVLNSISNELMKLMSKYMKGPGVFDEKTREKFDKLESIVQDKLGGETKPGEVPNQLAP